jgi:deoxycytidine triphosphate deaminase
MSVIHIKERSTPDEELFTEQKSSQASLLLINEQAITDRFSLELTVGTAWAKVFSSTEKSFVQIDANGVQIGRHDSIVIEVAEDIRVPNNMYGLLVPTGSLFLGLGVLVAPAKIEPGYSGKLTLRLFNTTAEKHTLTIGQKLGSAIFFPTETTLDHATLKRERGTSTPTYGKFVRMKKWAATNPVIWITMIINILGSSTVAAFVALSIAEDSPKSNTEIKQNINIPTSAASKPTK